MPAGLPAAARRRLPSCPELLVLSQEEAILISITGDAGFLKDTCKLTLESAPVSSTLRRAAGHRPSRVYDAIAPSCSAAQTCPPQPSRVQ